MIKPILTEKSMSEAKKGAYTFFVGPKMNKKEIGRMVEKIYEVEVKKVRTINLKGGVRKNVRGRKVRIKARKKAIVNLKGDKKIDVFEEKKGK